MQNSREPRYRTDVLAAPVRDRTGAISVLDQVPLTSRHYGEAQLTSALILVDGRPMHEITEADLRDAAYSRYARSYSAPRWTGCGPAR